VIAQSVPALALSAGHAFSSNTEEMVFFLIEIMDFFREKVFRKSSSKT
jgi:hypothetical protein